MIGMNGGGFVREECVGRSPRDELGFHEMSQLLAATAI